VNEDEGASCLEAHTSSLEHLCSIPEDPACPRLPAM
jgi:hypothetical protein